MAIIADTDEFVFKSPPQKTSVIEMSGAEEVSPTVSPVAASKRLSSLDAFIADKRRELDARLQQLASERLAEHHNQQRQAEKDRETTVTSQLTSPTMDATKESPFQKWIQEEKARIQSADAHDKDMFEHMRVKAADTWTELQAERTQRLQRREAEQDKKMAEDADIVSTLKDGSPVFDRSLFDRTVERCGRGRDSVYARDKMQRFWQTLDRSFPPSTVKETSIPAMSASSDEKDAKRRLLAALEGQL